MQNRPILVDVAYKYLCKKKKSNFLNIWAHVKKQCNITALEEEKAAGDLYTGMILDTNFFLKNDKIWYPRSEVSLEEIRCQMITIDKEVYDISDNTELTIDSLASDKVLKTSDDEDDFEADSEQEEVSGEIEDNYDE